MIAGLKKKWAAYKRAVDQRERLALWKANGREGVPPDVYKQAVVRRFAEVFELSTLVETGTYKGYMVAAVKDVFAKVYSIELGVDLAAEAQRQFSRDAQVTILQGDSATCLPEVLAELTTPALFWLDAHYSGGITAKGDESTPISREIKLVLAHAAQKNLPHVLLIDDAMSFTEESADYPSVAAVRAQIAEVYPDWTFLLADNIMRAHPPTVAADHLVV